MLLFQGKGTTWVFRSCCLVLMGTLLMSCTRTVKTCSQPDVVGVETEPDVTVTEKFDGRMFIANTGQMQDATVHFYTWYQGRLVTFGTGAVVFDGPRGPVIREGGVARPGANTLGGQPRMEFGNHPVLPSPRGLLRSYSNFYLHARADAWQRGVPHFERIVYSEVYPKVDLVFFFDARGRLTFEYHVGPGGNPSQIAIRYSGVEQLRLTDGGQIVGNGGGGGFHQSAPVTYQTHEAIREVVSSHHVLPSPNVVAFQFPEGFDSSRTLVIDPTVEFSTYWGSGGATNRTVSIDSAGNIYMAGGTPKQNWPSTLGRRHCGGFDVTVAKFDPQGHLLWSTLLGGPYEDYAYVSAVSEQGELYLSGRAGEGYPTTPGAFDRTFNGGIGGGPHLPTDAFVTKLSTDGYIIYSTYIGGNGDENGRAIHLLPSGKLIVGGGNTISDDLPTDKGTLEGPVLKPKKGGLKDGWVAVVAADGGSLDFCTYFGPDDDNNKRGDETIRALGVDDQGNIWIGGTTQGSGMVPTPNAFQQVRGQGSHRSEGYIAKISRDGKHLKYFSWLGGNGADEIETEGVSDASGNFFVAGSTGSTDFPVTPGAFQRVLRGGKGKQYVDGWVAKINNDGSLGFATLFGGSDEGSEGFFGPVVDQQGHVYVTGRFRSTDLPVTEHAFQSKFGGKLDAFLAIFSEDGRQLLYGSYIGGSRGDQARHLGISPKGDAVFIVGETTSTNFPLVHPTQATPSGAFLLKVSISDLQGERPAESKNPQDVVQKTLQ